MAHHMPLAGAVHHITVTRINRNIVKSTQLPSTCSARHNVLVHPEEILRIILALDLLEPGIGFRPEGVSNEAVTFSEARKV